MALVLKRFFNWLRELADGGTFIESDGQRVRIPDDWQQMTVRGDGLNRWNIKDDDTVVIEPVSGLVDGTPIVVIDTELSMTQQNMLKFCCYFDMQPTADDYQSRRPTFYQEHKELMPGLDPVFWNTMCAGYQRRIVRDSRLVQCDNTHVAVVCAYYSFRYHYFMIPAESITGRVRYVIDER